MKHIYYPPPPPFIGGKGPFLPRRLPPSELAVPVNDPPFSSRLRSVATLAIIIGMWQPSLLGLPQGRARFIVQPGPVVADNPPFTSRTVLPTILAAWEPPPPQPQVAKKLPASIIAVPENNPPFSQRSSLSTILDTWQPKVPLRIQRVFVPKILAVDNPPFGQRIWLSTILRAWEPAPPLPWLVSYFTEEGIVPVGQNVPGTRYRRRHRSRTIYS